jgi:hypothetical protein
MGNPRGVRQIARIPRFRKPAGSTHHVAGEHGVDRADAQEVVVDGLVELEIGRLDARERALLGARGRADTRPHPEQLEPRLEEADLVTEIVLLFLR